MKIKNIALVASLIFATSGTSVIVAKDKSSARSTVTTTKKGEVAKSKSKLSGYNWMHLSIGAILIVLFLLIVVIFWVRRRKK